MTDLIKELRELALLCCSEDGEGAWWQKKILEILSRHAEPKEDKAVEPLAVLAERKGQTLSMVEIELNDDEPTEIYFAGKDYRAAEAKARQYLEALPDVKGGE